jgi:2-octaprenyl-3-methyl-6-methoxy-1,4-benzoquinol hydroxylase/2-octaprenylphenol hydroxylase
VNKLLQVDVAVVGAGMVGSATAALAARAGFSVAVVEASEPRAFDATGPVGQRVSAFSPGSADILSEAGAWRLIERQRHCHYRRMCVEDRDEQAAVEFEAAEFGMDRLGTIVENDLVQWALWQSLLVMGDVEPLCPDQVAEFSVAEEGVRLELNSGTRLDARLLVAADGADSAIRRTLGIEQDVWEYGQCGLVGVVETRQPNPGLAWQRFLEGGPIAFLPLADGRSSIVWSQPESRIRRLLELEDESFLQELQVAVSGGDGHWPDEVLSVGPRAAFPLTMRLSHRYASGPVVLVGDAAHVVHPLAGQGVNLGLLDAAALVELLVAARKAGEAPFSGTVLARYARWRRSEAEVMARGIHGLRGLFMPAELGTLRRLGMGLVSKSWLAREAFIRRACGRNPGSPALARGTPLKNLLHSSGGA